MASDELLAQATEWALHDPDPETRAELLGLIEEQPEQLAERFGGPLAFGTAGLRGIIGAGESRMNRAVVRRTSAGLARYLLDYESATGRSRGVVVGYDGRHMSSEFAQDTAAVLCAAGIGVHLCNTVCPTPLLAYAVRDLDAVAGVMITASHNPPAYNGYKVYGANGALITPPADQRIAAAIERCGPADTVPTIDLAPATAQGLLRRFGAELERRYLDAIAQLVPPVHGDRSLGIVYTPLHGVGEALLRNALRRAGFDAVETVPEQAEPDGDFPTVAFPNPEERGALDLALSLARQRGADLILANDPDADRLAVAARDRRGEFVQLTGNAVGALLGHFLLTADPDPSGERLVVNTVVSSPLLGVMARALGVRHVETLTGFKWITNRAMQIERETGARFVFGFEEALGYTIGTVVRDKDGISAALVMATLAAKLRAEGKTLLDELDRIAEQYGLFASTLRAVSLPDSGGMERIDGAMRRLRANPPQRLGGCAVLAVVDLATGQRHEPGREPSPIELPTANVVVFELEGGHRAVARPSGTEPKLKLYIDVRECRNEGEALGQARERAHARLERIGADFVRAAGL